MPACYKVECASFCAAGCDHRGASSDHRMLKLLQDVLGLEQALPKEESSRLQASMMLASQSWEHSFCRMQASRSWELIADSCMLGVCGKLGCRSLNFRRKRLSYVVYLMAASAVAISLYLLVFGNTTNYDLLVDHSWGSGKLNYNRHFPTDLATSAVDDRHNGPESRFHLGVRSFSFAGRWIVKQNVSWIQYGNLDLYLSDTTCSVKHQRHAGVAFGNLQNPSEAMVVGMRSAGTSMCVKINCYNREAFIYKYSNFHGCLQNITLEIASTSYRALWANQFSSHGGCTLVRFPWNGTEYSMSMRVTCQPMDENVPVDSYVSNVVLGHSSVLAQTTISFQGLSSLSASAASGLTTAVPIEPDSQRD